MKIVLCVPGHNERMVARCRDYGADLVLFDLEDGVPESAKDRARDAVAAAVRPGDAVRINSGVRAVRDAEAVAARATVWLPKGEDWRDWTVAAKAFGLRACVPLIESPRALLLVLSELRCVATSPMPVQAVAFGAADYATRAGVPQRGLQVEHARANVVLIGHALEVDAIDSPCVSLDEHVVRDETRRACALGFQWKGAVHPRQIGWIRDESAALEAIERQRAETALLAYDAQSEAAMFLDGEMLAPPMVKSARRAAGATR